MALNATINRTSRARTGTHARLSPQRNLLEKGHIVATGHPIPTHRLFQDLTGRAFNQWTVLTYAGNDSGGKSLWNCVCNCGKEKVVRGTSLTGDGTVSCGSCRSRTTEEQEESHFREKLLQSVNHTESKCWEWRRGKNRQGYGVINVRRRSVLTHVLSYRVFIGRIEDHLFVLHKCDNPPCINPMHLFLGTTQDNMDDMVAKGRQNKLKGERHVHSKLTQSQVDHIRRTYSPSYGALRALAKQYEVHESTMRKIIHNTSWSHSVMEPSP